MIHYARKRFGQHFLHDQNIIEKIVGAIAPKPDDHIVEIGPGLGALTTKILPLTKKLDVIEIDRDIIPKLIAQCTGLGELIVHETDALKFDFAKLNKDKLRLVGNLPYNISTPLLFHILNNTTLIQDMYFMLQKEVVERMAAQPGEEAYGRLSVMLQYHCQAQLLFLVPPHAFNPPPKVDSAIVKLTPYASLPFVARNYGLFAEIVRTAFTQRRKTLRNCLRTLIDEKQLIALEIDPNLRPEKLSVEDFVKIANGLKNAD